MDKDMVIGEMAAGHLFTGCVGDIMTACHGCWKCADDNRLLGRGVYFMTGRF